jgi:nucleoside-diphosphate-sugar epimerase
MARMVSHALARWDEARDRVYNVGHESMNYTKEDIVRLLEGRLAFALHFADVGRDEDRRDYEVSYARVRGIGFATEVDIHRGLDELVRGLPLVRGGSRYGNV